MQDSYWVRHFSGAQRIDQQKSAMKESALSQ